jgi:hypothetical protein
VLVVRLSLRLGVSRGLRLGEQMTSEISVERQFHFHCSCGAITITGERTVTCTGCGITLGVRRVRRHRQRSDTVTYYGRTIPVRRVKKRRPHLNTTVRVPNARILSRFSAWVKTALAKCVKAINVHRIKRKLKYCTKPATNRVGYLKSTSRQEEASVKEYTSRLDRIGQTANRIRMRAKLAGLRNL